MQLNAWHNKLLPKIIELINEEDVDVICLQEFVIAEEPTLFADFFFDGEQHIKAKTALQYSFFTPRFTFTAGGKQATEGNMIFSKTPFLSTEETYTLGNPIEDFAMVPGKPARVHSLQIVRIESKNGPLSVANHHGYWLPDPKGDDTSIKMMQRVADVLSKKPGPVVLCGDMNVAADTGAMQVFDSFLVNQTKKYGLDTTLSQLHHLSGVAIACDHVLVSEDVRVQDFYASNTPVSDHKAIILSIDS